MAKRKRSSVSAASASAAPQPLASQHPHPPALKSATPVVSAPNLAPPPASAPNRRLSQRTAAPTSAATTNPDRNPTIIDGATALRASPTGDSNAGIIPPPLCTDGQVSYSGLPDAPTLEPPAKKMRGARRDAASKPAAKSGPQGLAVGVGSSVSRSAGKAGTATSPGRITCEDDIQNDPEAEDDEQIDDADVEQALARPPPVDSDYLPLPWKGRLGYACLNTYLRNANPPVFSSRTCRIASILEHRHPLKDPSLPEHPTKNRPDRDQPANVARGQAYVEALGLANAGDVVKMLRWNDRYGIKFMRLSSEMFPFASHAEYGYKLAPFAAETLAEAGKVVAELGHRVTTHPGQFTQLGSPRAPVITASLRDLAYHDELLSLLRLPPQQNRDAVMILHMGGVFGDKLETLARFRTNYATLPQSVKNRLVLENDDVSWHVHDLLPVCEELNIPLVLDFHHHNILFDASAVREGTADVVGLFPRIRATWTRKGITQKMHYSESEPQAVTARQRRKHSPRVKTLPPCVAEMDLMIEAKDKEQAVFELMKVFRLPGFERLADLVPYCRDDENRPVAKRAAPKKGRKIKGEELEEVGEQIESQEAVKEVVREEDVGMGGPDGRVYWPPGMEEWLRPKKRVVVKKEDGGKATPAKKAKAKDAGNPAQDIVKVEQEDEVAAPAKRPAPKRAASARKKAAKEVPTPSTSDGEDEVDDFSTLETEVEVQPKRANGVKAKPAARKSKRAQKVNYAEEE
ncbi:UV-endonuclease UvdE [Lophium mytilinum]|uniref:UV-endonuclease UvdE n=1 Tax=Lophium mytilinum TaxID=390894 RepID=A0A6A6R210_9PEZI|nr:UV-endonuclease UvdE [Lophium mytilinum]